MRAFISYAHDDLEHEERVRQFWLFLRANGVDAVLDLAATDQRTGWTQWMTQQVRDADRVLVVASPAYRRRAEGDAGPAEGRGVQWEAGLIQELFYADQQAGLGRFLPVVLPGCSATDIPLWMRPASTTRYEITDFTVAGAKALLRVLTSQPGVIVPPVGPAPFLPPDDAGRAGPAATQQPVLDTGVVIEAALSAGVLESAVWVAGSLLSHRQVPLPAEVTWVWGALTLPAVVAEERMAAAGRRLAGALLADADQHLLARMLNRLPPGGTAQVVLCADAAALSLPVELIRLATGDGPETAPLGLLPTVSVVRRPTGPGREPGTPPGPPPRRRAPRWPGR